MCSIRANQFNVRCIWKINQRDKYIDIWKSSGKLWFFVSVYVLKVQMKLHSSLKMQWPTMPVLRNQLAHSKRLWMTSGRFLWIGRGLANLRLTSIRSTSFPTLRSCLWGFLGSLRLRSQLISVSVSMQISIILRRIGIALYRRPPHGCAVIRYTWP